MAPARVELTIELACETWTVLNSETQPVIAGWSAIWAKTASGDPADRIMPSAWSGAAV